jgi:hypothetical protein
MQTSFFVALISLAVFVQAAPTPQLPGVPRVPGVSQPVILTGAAGALQSVGPVFGEVPPGAPAPAPAPAGGKARSVKDPLTVWKRQGSLDSI